LSLRSEARTLAEDSIRSAIQSLGLAIERRLQWRWDNAPLLAREAELMVLLLEHDPGRVVLRRVRVGHWTRRHRRFAAKAWAQDPAFAEACRICREVA
jgi:hypothetical protein